MRVGFGEFLFDTSEQRLHRGAEPVALSPKAMRLLEILLARRPAVVTHAELYDALWPDVVVLEANLKNVVSELRRALDDRQRDGRFLRTVHRRGYAFCGVACELAVSPRGPVPAVVVYIGERAYPLAAGEHVVGRGPECAIRIDHDRTSRHHAVVAIDADVIVRDLSSKNGTFVNGERVTVAKLVDGARIQFGDVVAHVRIGDQPSTASGVD